jgi:class 3 adenylate cyclase
MPVLSFRLKLVLAMMLVVAGVSVTTLFITQRRVQVTYEKTFRNQFERQINYFTSLQETRLGAVKEQCLKLSQSPVLISALQQDNPEGETVYLSASNELRAILISVFQENRMTLNAPRRASGMFFRFLDARGKVIEPPERMRAQYLALGYARRIIDQKVARVRGAIEGPEKQQVGYLALAQLTNQVAPRPNQARKAPPLPVNDDTNTAALQEVILTKINDPARDAPVGAMVVGFLLPELIPQAKTDKQANPAAQSESIQTGILLEEHLYANTNVIPEAMATSVGQELSQKIHATQKPKDEFDCKIQNQEYRIFYDLLNQGSAFPQAYRACLYSLEEVRQEQKELRWEILGSGGLALIAALLLSMALSHGLVVPIRELVRGTDEIRQGNFDVEVPVRSRDELGQLAESFNEMAAGLVQKERYRTVLNLVADEKVAEHLISGGIALGGEKREVSILFCDIRNFTALTQNMPPGEVIEMLNEHMTALTRVVKEYKGVLDKFVGDLLMAVFGAPVSHGNDALDAAHCALGLLRKRQELNETSQYKLDIGIGLASGPVVAGCMGSTDRLNYTVLGERVNLASRLCDHAKPGEVLIDQTTFERLGNLIVAEPISVLELKGFASQVQAYRLKEAMVVAESV